MAEPGVLIGRLTLSADSQVAARTKEPRAADQVWSRRVGAADHKTRQHRHAADDIGRKTTRDGLGSSGGRSHRAR